MVPQPVCSAIGPEPDLQGSAVPFRLSASLKNESHPFHGRQFARFSYHFEHLRHLAAQQSVRQCDGT